MHLWVCYLTIMVNGLFEKFETITPLQSLKSLHNTIHALTKNRLWLKVIIGLFLGIGMGILLGPDVEIVKPSTSRIVTDWLTLPGHFFLRLVKMIIIPLVFSSIIIGLVSSGDPEFLKKIGPRLTLYFIVTTTIAILIGFFVAFTINPGKYVNASEILPQQTSIPDKEIASEEFNIPEKIIDIFPDNPFQAIVAGELLGVVIFTIIVGIALLALDNKYAEPMVRLLESVQQI